LLIKALMQREASLKLWDNQLQSPSYTIRPNHFEFFEHRFDVVMHLETVHSCLARKTPAVNSQPGLAIAAAQTISPDVMRAHRGKRAYGYTSRSPDQSRTSSAI